MDERRIIALAGNPNVGKSTVFNALTGLHQHTGNWPGKTVASARGTCRHNGRQYTLVDVPGAYSLWAQSAEEEVALEAVCFGGAEAVIVVCDATCLERNLNLVYQVMEITPRVVVAVNMLDEARKKGVRVDLKALEAKLGVPVAGVCARAGKGVGEILDRAEQVLQKAPVPRRAVYPEAIEKAAQTLAADIAPWLSGLTDARFAALRLLENDPCFLRELEKRKPLSEECRARIAKAREALAMPDLSDYLVAAVYKAAEDCCRAVVTRPENTGNRQWKIDKVLTGRVTGMAAMLGLLCLVFFLTLKGANAPSRWLGAGFAWLGEKLEGGLNFLGAPPFLQSLLLDGVYGTLSQVISVMLPPMAIFFPLFTLLEDLGYLPRIAFRLDGIFEKCRACGKQALTMCMGFGCNAVGVMGCRIIDSPRERLIAVLTNAFVPCNGRFPTLIAMMTIFFAGGGLGGAALSAGMLTGLILLSVGVTLGMSYLLSVTALRGVPSSYTLELPPYRAPQAGKVIVRSVLDRTLFVLGRAAAVAAPAGLVIFLLSHIPAGEGTLLTALVHLLSPLGRLMGLDGAILTGFLLGFPANEIVLPMILMIYTAGGALADASNLSAVGEILRANGWTAVTALNLMLFSLFHFPCSTTCITIYRETGAVKWTAMAALLPTLVGMLLCMAVHGISLIL